MMQAVPRWVTTDGPIQAAYDALVGRVGPCVLLAHSQGGNFAFTAALHAPRTVKAVIAVEPSGAPPLTADAASLRGVPHLVVWGDHLADSPLWPGLRRAVDAWMGRIREEGGVAETLDLPAEGIRGNSHMLMMDDNSDEVARRIDAWLARQGLMREG